jgi:hypothetical protein
MENFEEPESVTRKTSKYTDDSVKPQDFEDQKVIFSEGVTDKEKFGHPFNTDLELPKETTWSKSWDCIANFGEKVI